MWWRDALNALEKAMLDNLTDAQDLDRERLVFLQCQLVHLDQHREDFEKRIDSAERQIDNIETEARRIRKEIDRFEQAQVSREEAAG